MPEPAVEIVRSNLSEHPAVLAWSQLAQGGSEPREILVLSKRVKSSIYRLVGASPSRPSVVAKYCQRQTASHERIIYEEILPKLPVTAPRFYGFIMGKTDYDWLFLEDVQGERYSRSNEAHSILAARWLGLLHTSAAKLGAAEVLPERGPEYFLGQLKVAHQRLSRSLSTLDLTPPDFAVFATVVSQCAFLKSHWNQIERWCERMPRTLIHGDFKPRNAVIRHGRERTAFLPFDWEASGWGVPAADLAFIDIPVYHSTVQDVWPTLDFRDVRRMAVVGKIFRAIAEFNWESQKFDPRWEFSTIKLRIYQDRMTEAIGMAGWET
jgi:Phosphotransferase enzyme family